MVPDEAEEIAEIGCSDAVAREAAPSSAIIDDSDIAQRMPPGAVNLIQVASAMVRGPIQQECGESPHRLEDDDDIRRATDVRNDCGKTSDVARLE